MLPIAGFVYYKFNYMSKLLIPAANSSTRLIRSGIVLGFISSTYFVAWLQNEKLSGDKFVEYGGHWCFVFLEIIRPPNLSFKKAKHGSETWQMASILAPGGNALHS